MASSVSGLSAAAPSSAMLHQAHQARDYDAPGDKYTYEIPFSNPTAGSNNVLQIPSMDMVISECVVKFVMETVATGGYVPVQNWISSNGVQLMYNNASQLTISEPEAMLYNYANSTTADLHRRMTMTNDNATAALCISESNVSADQGTYYMDLRPFLKILNGCGAISAYASNKWSISVGLQALANLMWSTDATPGTGAGIVSMSLLLTGHREDAQNVERVSQSLATDGISLKFTQANHIRSSLASATGQTVIPMPQLEGEMTDIWIANRVTAGLTSALGTSAVDRQQWEIMPRSNQTIAIGTVTNPTRLFGQEFPIETVRLVTAGSSYEGSPKFTDQNASVRNMSVLYVPIAEAASEGQKYGTYTGSIRLKNDLQVRYTMGTAPAVANTIDIIVYIRRVMLITHLGTVLMNEA